MSEASTADAVASSAVVVTAVRWRAEDTAMTNAIAAALAPSHGSVVAQCRACPPKPGIAKNEMLGAAVTGLLPSEAWMLVIRFDSVDDASAWAASYSRHFDLIHCVPAA